MFAHPAMKNFTIHVTAYIKQFLLTKLLVLRSKEASFFFLGGGGGGWGIKLLNSGNKVFYFSNLSSEYGITPSTTKPCI
jgi:hypothetical protein